MSFHQSAQNIRVDDGHMLRADLQNANGDWVGAEFDLNQCLGNNDGHFTWQGTDFAGSCQNVNFNLEGDENVPILRAVLIDSEGNGQDRDVNLSECIGNSDGQFYFTG